MGKNRNYEINTIKELYARSGNRCAFPGCSNDLFIDDNINLSEICHIYGLNPGSARYNPQLTNKDANKISNLILLCSHHHKMVDSKPDDFPPDTLISMKASHEEKIARNQEILFNIPKSGDTIDLYQFEKWLRRNDYDYTQEQIIKTINKVLVQNVNTRVVLAKIIDVYCDNKDINMREVLNELAYTDYQLAYQLKLLEEMKFISEERFTETSLESLIQLEDGSLCDISDNYIIKIDNGEWYLAKRGKIIFLICKYINGYQNFLDFLINGNISHLNKR